MHGRSNAVSGFFRSDHLSLFSRSSGARGCVYISVGVLLFERHDRGKRCISIKPRVRYVKTKHRVVDPDVRQASAKARRRVCRTKTSKSTIGGFTNDEVVVGCCATIDDKRCRGAKQERRVVDQKGSKAIPSLLAPSPFLSNAQRPAGSTSISDRRTLHR